jgi:hypothetical protein
MKEVDHRIYQILDEKWKHEDAFNQEDEDDQEDDSNQEDYLSSIFQIRTILNLNNC